MADMTRAQSLYYGARRRAQKKGLPFALTLEDIERRLAAGLCEQTGLPLVFETNYKWRSHPFAPSIDRIEPSLGYIPSNILVVAMGINQMKSQYEPHIVRVLAKAFLNSTAGEPYGSR